MKVSTLTSFTSPESLRKILDANYPLITPLYYTPKKEEGIMYEHIKYSTDTGCRYVITHFEDEALRIEQNQILNDTFELHYNMNFFTAMAAIGIYTETIVL